MVAIKNIAVKTMELTFLDIREAEARLYAWGSWARRDGIADLQPTCITGVIDRQHNGRVIKITDVERIAEDAEAERTERFISKLPDPQRKLVKRRYIPRHSYEDLADLYGKSPATWMRRTHEMLERLLGMGW